MSGIWGAIVKEKRSKQIFPRQQYIYIYDDDKTQKQTNQTSAASETMRGRGRCCCGKLVDAAHLARGSHHLFARVCTSKGCAHSECVFVEYIYCTMNRPIKPASLGTLCNFKTQPLAFHLSPRGNLRADLLYILCARLARLSQIARVCGHCADDELSYLAYDDMTHQPQTYTRLC